MLLRPAVRQPLPAIVAFYQKYVDEASKREIKETLLQFDRSLLVAERAAASPRSSAVVVPAH